MVMLGCEFMGEVPFRQVYIHGLVRDAEKQKMSKTRGNVVDPLVVTEKYGTDAVRMALLQGAAPGTDIVLTEDRMESSRAFANKIWNAARLLLMNAEVGQALGLPGSIEDRWIFSRLNATAEQANRAIDQYRYHEFAQLLWHFFWHEFCDWYLELKKASGQQWESAVAAFETALRLLHPAMPFLTEELWQRLDIPDRPKSIALAPYPQYRDELNDPEAEMEISILQEIVTMARTLRTEAKLDPKQPLEGTLYCRTGALAIAQRHAAAIRKLANVTLEFKSESAPRSAAMRSTAEFDVVLHVPAAQEQAQRKRIEKELEQLEKNISNIERQLNDEVFLGKAPPKVIESLRSKLADYKAQREKLL
jgi:valyl-tRNA synthetase